MAINLAKMQAESPGLVDLYKKARTSLDKKKLAGTKAAVYLVVDHSGSMRGYFANGSVQALAERVLALAAHFDDDGTVPVVFFDAVAHDPVDVSVADYTGAIDRINNIAGRMRTTDYAAAMRAVIAHYRSIRKTVPNPAPAFVVFQTDGSPDSEADAKRAMQEASGLPIFWQFIGFGNDDFDFLRKLDALPGRRVDNAGFFAAGADPRALPDSELYDLLLAEFPAWLAAARDAGILPAAAGP